jgi:hypothetical protein
VPDRRHHRGMHPQDPQLFGADAQGALRAACRELSYLLEHGYALDSSLKLVGDRHALVARQRAALSRAACSDRARALRRSKAVSREALAGEALFIDGFNVLTTLEVALSGGVLLAARDGVMRDIAGVHGNYRKVEETCLAIDLLAGQLRTLGLARCVWLLDRPVSNSGRLRALLLERAQLHGVAWEASVVHDPDKDLVAACGVVASADGPVLDRVERYWNLARDIIERAIPSAYVVNLEDA